MESKTTRVLIMIFGITGIVALTLSVFLMPGPHYGSRTFLLVACAWKLIFDFLQSSVISRRKLPEGISLLYRTPVIDIFAYCFVIGVILFLLITDMPRAHLAFLCVINLNGQLFILPHYLKRSVPRFHLTADTLIENGWFAREHELSELHTVEFSGFFDAITLCFHNQNVEIKRWSYTKAERAAFIREVITRAGGNPFIHQNVRVFLDEHAPAR
jgi:hypothetical protein